MFAKWLNWILFGSHLTESKHGPCFNICYVPMGRSERARPRMAQPLSVVERKTVLFQGS